MFRDRANDLFRSVLVAWEFRTKRKIRLWQDELGTLPPYSLGPESLFVAYLASAEIGFHLALGWPKPARILDLYVEYRNRYNCLPTIVEQKLYKKDEKKIKKNSLIGALIQFGLDTIGISEKQEMLDLILTGGPWTPAQKLAIIDYCESDVAGLDRLLSAMLPHLDVPRSLYRGRYTASVASMEAVEYRSMSNCSPDYAIVGNRSNRNWLPVSTLNMAFMKGPLFAIAGLNVGWQSMEYFGRVTLMAS
jgi:hypothetical protein